MRTALINARWPVNLPNHRADFHEVKPWWEAARLADMYAHISASYEQPFKILDVGSEEGDLSTLYGLWGSEVACIDPSKPWMNQTLTTFQQNGLSLPVTFNGLADHKDYIEGKPVEHARFVDIDEPQVARITLDTFCDWFDFRPDAVTMDVEGSEDRVLEGAQMLLTEDIVWWISIHEDVNPHAAMPSRIHKFMRDRGFKDQFLAYDHEWHYRFWRP